MPAYRWSSVHGIWVKQCSKCDWIYLGTENQDASIKEFENHFGTLNEEGTARALDGFRAACRSCESDRRHNRPIRNRNEILQEQSGKCLLCDKDLTFNYSREANVDHDHKTGRTRGILCSRCNTQMAGIDNDEWLQRAIAYRDSFR